MNKRHLIRVTALALSALLLAGPGWTQEFPPKKPVTLMVGFAPAAPPTRPPASLPRSWARTSARP